MAHTNEVYLANPLAFSNSTNIRLVKVLSHQPGAPILAELHVVSVEECPTYIALSYVWGAETPGKSILSCGSPFTVRQNLWDFLQRVSSQELTEFFWIDALCIDQSNIAERSHQVALMGDVYSKAKKVIAWLGVEASSVRVCKELNDYLKPSSGRQLAGVLGPFNDIEYFDRAWVVQEFVLAKEVEIWCGQLIYMDADDLGRDCCWSIRGYAKKVDRLLNMRSRCFGSQTRDTSHETLMSILPQLLPRRGCTDVRDRIYYLLSLLDPVELARYPIPVDYNKSAESMFFNLFEGI